MVELDGVQINRVIEIKCNYDTGFDIHISFLVDDRLEGCTDPNQFDKYKVSKTTYNDEEIDYATVVFPNEDGYKTIFVNDNQK